MIFWKTQKFRISKIQKFKKQKTQKNLSEFFLFLKF